MSSDNALHPGAVRRLAGRLGAALAVVGAAAALSASSAQAFGTVWGVLGQHSEHERVTRLALQCGGAVQPPECFQPTSLDNLAGTRGSFGAVGAPDDIPIHLVRDREYWHCDNADWVDPATHGLRGAYPQPRDVALLKLQQCLSWGRDKLYDGGTRGRWDPLPTATPSTGAVAAAAQLMKDPSHVDDSNPGVGTFSPACRFNGVQGSRPKCNVLEPFGYVLHMAEDFYAHTNWVDYARPRVPLSLTNPIGLGNSELARFLDLRTPSLRPDWVPADFTGSCYPKKQCDGRVIHGESSSDLGLNKDKGLIDIRTGEVTDPLTPRGAIVVGGVSNVRRAVTLAALEARRQWRVFRGELAQRYGTDLGAKMVCALVLDRSETCDRRNVVVAIDTSPPHEGLDPHGGSAGGTADRPSPVEAAAAQLVDRLQRTDRVAVLTFDGDSGAQDLDPFVAPAAARIDDAETGDPQPDPSVEGARDPRAGADPTVTPEPDPASEGPPPEGTYTHGSEEGGEENEETEDGPLDQTVDERPSAEQPEGSAGPSAEDRPEGSDAPEASAAQAGAGAPAAAALDSADGLLDDADLPRGQQGVVMIADGIRDAGALAGRIRALRKQGAVVSLAVYGTEAVPAAVVSAAEATGGTVIATRSAAELRRFAGLSDTAGLTRLDDVFPDRAATLASGAPAVLGVTRRTAARHDVERLARRARLTVRVLDRPLKLVVTDVVAARSVRVVATKRRPAAVSLKAGGNYEVAIAGAPGRRYEAEVDPAGR